MAWRGPVGTLPISFHTIVVAVTVVAVTAVAAACICICSQENRKKDGERWRKMVIL